MVSLWRADTEPVVFGPLEEDISVDAAIIGGGMAGVLTAWFLSQKGLNTVIIEADHIGAGVTGDTTAKVTAQHGLIYDKLIRQHGKEAALQYARWNSRAVGMYRDIIHAENIQCGWRECPSYVYSQADSAQLRAETAAACSLGLKAAFTEDTELPFPIAGAVRFDSQARFHPLEFLYHIGRGLRVYDQTRVMDVVDNTVITGNGRVKAEHVVFTSHYPIVDVPGYYFMRMYQQRSYVLALEGARAIEGMYVDADTNGLSFRSAADGLLLFGGFDIRTGKNPDGGKYELLRKRAAKLYPGCREKYAWSAQDCRTLDGIPYIGRYSGARPNWYVATGFDKWGMTSSMAAADIISSMIFGVEDTSADVFSPQRFKLTASAKRFGEEVGVISSALIRQTFTMPGDRARDIRPGSGGVVEYEGQKVGVYKDNDGEIYAVQTKCPHLGCQLQWNGDDKTWECPCHGSRFDYQGNILNSPARKGL